VDRKLTGDSRQLKELIRDHLLEVLRATEKPLPRVMQPPAVILVVGVNGSGKTTTIGKLAHRFKAEGHSVLLCAADTFVPPPTSSWRFGAAGRRPTSSIRKPAPIQAP